jgi:DNA-binding CsgD family transcriptional regulator
MARLSAARLQRVLEAAATVASYADLDDLRCGVLDTVRQLIRYDTASYNEIAPGAPAVVLANPVEAFDAASVTVFERFAWQNPLIAHYATNGSRDALRFSDLVSSRQLHRLDLYQALYRPMGIEHQLAASIGSPGSAVIGVALNRCEDDFADDDVAMLNLLRPFLGAAHRRLTELDQLRSMLAAFDADDGAHAVALIDGGGTVRRATVAAERLLEIQSPARLPGALLTWFARGRTDDDLLFVHAGRRLHARVGLAEGADRLHALVISEVRGSALRVGGQALGLSGRECEILELAGAGASNAQIAGRLRISVRTVDKHLEHVYRKLEVPGRAHALQRVLAAARGASEAGRSAPHPGPGG